MYGSNWSNYRMPSCARFSVYSTNICVTSIFYKVGGTSIFLQSCGIGGRALEVTNILVVKLKPRPAGTCQVLEQHYLRHNKNWNTNQTSNLKKQIKYWFLLKLNRSYDAIHVYLLKNLLVFISKIVILLGTSTEKSGSSTRCHQSKVLCK
jgi:hypothetical protein